MYLQRAWWTFSASVLLLAATLAAQSTQAIITGRIFDSRTGQPLPGARLLYFNQQTGETGVAVAGATGLFSLPSLAPGPYTLRAERPDYQPREWQSLDLGVAARLEVDFPLRPLREVLEPGEYNSVLLPEPREILPVIGPDLEAARPAPLDATSASSAVRQPSLSYVIDPRQIAEAPLSARNVYALITTLPAVTAAPVSGRGLQISANGQRASASNFLLDGVHNNDFLNTGSFSPTTPESIQEYRVSTNNYSAEYGQTGGFVADAVTRRGGEDLHGQAYFYFDQQRFDANTFQNNTAGLERNPFRQLFAGYSAGGPIVRNRLFFASSFEQFRSRSRRPKAVNILLPDRLRQCLGTQASSPVLDLYTQFPLIDPGNAVDLTTPGNPCGLARYTYGSPVAEDRSLALERFDYRSASGAHRLMTRLAISRTTQADYFYSPYQGLSEPLTRNNTGIMLGYVRSFGPNLVNDARVSVTNGGIEILRPHPEIPVLQLLTSPELGVVSPSAGSGLNFSARGNNYEAVDALTWTRGAHIVSVGGSLLLRRPRYLLSYLGDGLYNFNSGANPIQRFAAGIAGTVLVPISRQAFDRDQSVTALPGREYNQYVSNQFAGYAQDNIRLTPRLTLTAGLRYESFGTLRNLTDPRAFFLPGDGASIAERIARGAPRLQFDDRPVYRPDRNDFAGRLGISFALSRRTVMRAGFGMYYDRPFDNLMLDPRNAVLQLWNNLTYVYPATFYNRPISFNSSLQSALNGVRGLTLPFNGRQVPEYIFRQSATSIDSRIAHADGLELLWVDENLRTPRVQQWFASVQHEWLPGLTLDVNSSGAFGRKLLATDVVNRVCSLGCVTDFARLNGTYSDILYRSNMGSSNFAALGVTARYRGRRTFFQLAYTYSHSIDNQSDGLLSDPFNLAQTNLDTVGASQSQGIFTRQFDARADRASSDYDIRHNLYYYGLVDLPAARGGRPLSALTRGWSFSQTMAVRSGLPYTLFARASALQQVNPQPAVLIGVRMDVLPGATVACDAGCERPGGRQLVNAAALKAPATGSIGDLGRNALAGPGFWNMDLALTRTIAFPQFGEAGRIRLGASVFNAFNHSNLGLPDGQGLAAYGPTENQAQFPAALNGFPSPRRVQFQLRVIF